MEVGSGVVAGWGGDLVVQDSHIAAVFDVKYYWKCVKSILAF